MTHRQVWGSSGHAAPDRRGRAGMLREGRGGGIGDLMRFGVKPARFGIPDFKRDRFAPNYLKNGVDFSWVSNGRG